MENNVESEKHLHYSDKPIIEGGEIIGYALVGEITTDMSRLTAFDSLMQKGSKSEIQQ